jgi:hypothetical protein
VATRFRDVLLAHPGMLGVDSAARFRRTLDILIDGYAAG